MSGLTEYTFFAILCCFFFFLFSFFGIPEKVLSENRRILTHLSTHSATTRFPVKLLVMGGYKIIQSLHDLSPCEEGALLLTRKTHSRSCSHCQI